MTTKWEITKAGRKEKVFRFLRVLKHQMLERVFIYLVFIYVIKCAGYQKLTFYNCLSLWSF